MALKLWDRGSSSARDVYRYQRENSDNWIHRAEDYPGSKKHEHTGWLESKYRSGSLDRRNILQFRKGK